jgi:predicted metal-dependent phosphoesterase TrpH
MIIDCLLHVHSSFSYDSRTDLGEIDAIARRHGFGAVLMSEHNNRLNDEQVAAFVRRCDELSDDRLLIVPGLELAFDANRVHLLAYGVRTYIDSTSPDRTFQGLVRATHEAGGLAVLAHPSHKEAIERLSIDDLRDLDGVEIWNVKNGNRFVPTASDVRLLQRLRSAAGGQFGYGGVDWHHVANFTPLAVEIDAAQISWPGLRDGLRNGRFRIRGRFAAIGASGDIGRGRVAVYHVAATALARTRRVAYRWQHKLERTGYKTPRFVAAIARRFF